MAVIIVFGSVFSGQILDGGPGDATKGNLRKSLIFGICRNPHVQVDVAPQNFIE
jgi:hypothetical protein